MFFKKTHALMLLTFLCASFIQATQAFITPLMPFVVHNYAQQGNEKNLIMILDVKQHEQFFGACGFTLATALQDKVSPILFSEHALCFVESYFKPHEWLMYKNKTLLLFIPKAYLTTKGLKDSAQAGFNLAGWERFEIQADSLSGADLYTQIASDISDFATFEDLSRQSTAIICKTLNKGNYGWKIYAVGHGAPDAHQVCGLNLTDFRSLLETLHKDVKTDFFIYQTCFGGGKNQLQEVYKLHQGTFKKFNYPIISGSLTNSVSFAFRPDSGISFKGIFAKVNNSMITELKMRRLLKAVNQLNRCLDFVSKYHASNNLLLIRMPHSEYFEPVVDNKSVFKLSALPSTYDPNIMHDAQKCKCFLIDKPIIDMTIDLKDVSNFIIASGISRSRHFIKELKLPSMTGTPEEILSDVVNLFNGLINPEKDKIFYVEKLEIGRHIFKNVTIMHKKNFFYFTQKLKISAQDTSSCLYEGEVEFMVGEPDKLLSTICMKSDGESRNYAAQYKKAVEKHCKKKHVLPFNAATHHEEVFSVA